MTNERREVLAALRGKRVTVMGLGLFGGGVNTVRWLARQGAQVTVTDKKQVAALARSVEKLNDVDARFVLGAHREADFAEADVVVANPAVPPHNKWLVLARERGACVTSEMELFLQHCPARVVLVTGTQGKSSTCHFLAQLLEGHAPAVHLGGNIGNALLAKTSQMSPHDIAVVEISSYQLEALPRRTAAERAALRVPVVAITNLLADHLERHHDVAHYHAAKWRIADQVSVQGAVAYPASCERPYAPDDAQLRQHGPGGDWYCGKDAFELEGQRVRDRSRLIGAFQRDNVVLAAGIAHALGVASAVISARSAKLHGLPHRLAELGLRAGRRVVDNGVSTTPDSTVSALEAIDGPCTLLCGGQAKRGLVFDELVRTARMRSTRVVTFGAAAPAMTRAFEDAGVEVVAADDLESATDRALGLTAAGETLLFSPACASFDAFENFKERALAFQRFAAVDADAD